MIKRAIKSLGRLLGVEITCVKAERLFWRKPLATLLQDKVDLIDLAFSRLNLHSFADLGGVWRVEGGYTFYTLEEYDVSAGAIVDNHLTDVIHNRARKFAQLRVIRGNFGDEMIAREVGNVDAIFLFDVLLHQVSPDWHRILEMYARQTKCFIIYNQQWIGSERTVRLLELGEDEYFRNVPHERTEKPYDNLFQKLELKHPVRDNLWRDDCSIWQWGITDTDLRAKIESLDFRLQFMKNCGRFWNLANFENHAFVFSK